MTSFDDFKFYSERVIPKLTAKQRAAHLAFAQAYRNNHGLGKGKFLMVHYDEKWFYGLVCRKNSKACPSLNAHPQDLKAHHKSHIEKVMVVAATAFAYEDNMESGGTGVKVGLFRCQVPRIAQRLQRAYNANTGKYDGDVVRKAGEIYYVDVNVTGTDMGTASDPKFALKFLFEFALIPKLEELLAPGGRFAGYTAIIQGDNASPHQQFRSWLKSEAERRKWHVKPQAAQMPHMNNLDLAVFPAMSKRHTAESRKQHGLKVLKKNEIWKTANAVWHAMPSAVVARGFVCAARIADKVIKEGGGNSFLGAGGSTSSVHSSLHSDLRKDFYDTDYGIARRDGMHALPNGTTLEKPRID